MAKKKIMCAVGTRPEFIRMSPIIKAVQQSSSLELQLLHTGQHYSYEMDKTFFDELNIPKPDVNLEVGSGSHARQTAEIMLRMEKVVEDLKPDLVVVFGDTNSSLAAALTAVKMQISLAHLEAGCRSYDLRMPEEANRRLIDHIADFLFPVSKYPAEILRGEKVPGKIFECGDPLYDVFRVNFGIARGKSGILRNLGLENQPFALLTLHRAETVDKQKTLKNIVSALKNIGSLPIVFPIHPRTEKRLEDFNLRKDLDRSTVDVTPPVGYWDFLVLLSMASWVITDSGGVQKEAFFARVPCLTLRRTTEWMETVDLGANTLIDPDDRKLSNLLAVAVEQAPRVREKLPALKNPYGDGHASERIVDFFARWEI